MTENEPAPYGERNLSDEVKELLVSLPKEKGWIGPLQYHYQGFWCAPPEGLQAVLGFQKHFQAKDSDILTASLPKSGTTWVKALTFAIVNRHRFTIDTHHPLLTSNPHELVPFFELKLYSNNQVPDLSRISEPRIFGTHIPYASLGTIKESNCKIVYVCRNPFDTLISSWNFFNKIRRKDKVPLTLDEAFDMFCRGPSAFGPFWDHMLGYWRESLKRPQNVLFLQYEDMKEDGVPELKKLAKFLDCPFTEEEEKNGLIDDIVKLCSFETMKNLEVNKTGKTDFLENTHLFRKGEIGDWVNHFTPEMVERMCEVIEEKFGGSGLTFKGIPKLADLVPVWNTSFCGFCCGRKPDEGLVNFVIGDLMCVRFWVYFP